MVFTMLMEFRSIGAPTRLVSKRILREELNDAARGGTSGLPDGLRGPCQGNRHLAYDSFLRAIKLDPNVSAYRLSLAITAQALARPADQLNDMAYFQASECCRIQPEALGNWVGFAEIAMLTHHYKEAIHAYEQALKLQPLNARLWCLLGFVHHKIDHTEEAKQCYLKSVELDPEQGQPQFLLSTCYTGKDYDPARIAYHGEKAFTVKHKATLSLEAMWNAAHGFLGIGCYEKGWGSSRPACTGTSRPGPRPCTLQISTADVKGDALAQF